jgi:hypothetical protein
MLDWFSCRLELLLRGCFALHGCVRCLMIGLLQPRLRVWVACTLHVTIPLLLPCKLEFTALFA